MENTGVSRVMGLVLMVMHHVMASIWNCENPLESVFGKQTFHPLLFMHAANHKHNRKF